MAGDLINRAACKEFVVKFAQAERRGWSPTRVSQRFLDDVNTRVRLMLQKSIKMHRSVGKTILDFH